MKMTGKEKGATTFHRSRANQVEPHHERLIVSIPPQLRVKAREALTFTVQAIIGVAIMYGLMFLAAL